MRPALLPFALAATVTALIGFGVWLEPYFAGDVAVTKALQGVFPEPVWAAWISRIASAPAKYWVMGAAIGLSYVLAGWRAALVAIGAILLDQYGSEATKAIVARPRPSADIVAVVGTPSGFAFPSTTLTFCCATFGWLAVLAARRPAGVLTRAVLAASSVMIVLACAARVVRGAHWPSDVVLTTVICLTWLWATDRVLTEVQP